jgi:hypothetical protein
MLQIADLRMKLHGAAKEQSRIMFEVIDAFCSFLAVMVSTDVSFELREVYRILSITNIVVVVCTLFSFQE